MVHVTEALRESLGLDLVVTVYVVQSAQWTLNCRDPICSRQFSWVVNRHSRENVRRALWTVASKSGRDSSAYNCADWATYTSCHDKIHRRLPSDSLKAATMCLLSVIYMHHGAIWCLDTHQGLQRLWLADTLRRSPPDSPGESAEMWADWDEIQSLVTRALVSGRADGKSGEIVSMYTGL